MGPNAFVLADAFAIALLASVPTFIVGTDRRATAQLATTFLFAVLAKFSLGAHYAMVPELVVSAML